MVGAAHVTSPQELFSWLSEPARARLESAWLSVLGAFNNGPVWKYIRWRRNVSESDYEEDP